MSEVTISCPHCRRQYTMKIDPERLQRLKTRATCGRCGKTFDAASRIVSPTSTTEPKLTRVDVKPPPSSQLVPTIKPLASSKTPTGPELRDEMEELAREFAEAAARFTPVGIKRSTLGLGDTASAAKLDEEPLTNPGVTPRSLATPPSTEPADLLDSIPGELDAGHAAAPSGTPSDDAQDELAAAVPTLARAVAAPKSWLDRADPGLQSLQSPPSEGAAALELLLAEREPPTPPTAS